MSDLLIGAAGFAVVVLVVTNLYWWRRVRTITDALTLSRDRAFEAATEPQANHHSAVDVTLNEAARYADVDPDNLPERVKEMDDKISTLSNELKTQQRAWADSWWEALAMEPVDQKEPHVLVVPLENGDVDVAQTFGGVAVEHDDAISIILGLLDGSCTVTVGENLSGDFSASAIVDEITDRSGGGGGGSESFATAGGTRPQTLRSAVEAVKEDLSSRLHSRVDR